MSDYPTINYIGNKRKVSSWIMECIPKDVKKVVDLFCGGCSVSYEFKKNGFYVIANDALYSNFVIAKAIIENSTTILDQSDIPNAKIIDNFDIQKNIKQLKFLINNIYFEHEVYELSKLITYSETLEGYKKYLFLCLLRRAMIRKIPYSRFNVKWEEIKKFRDEEYSYKKYGRYRHYHNISFLEHVNHNLFEYNQSIFKFNECQATNYDAIDCIKNINKKVDLIYFDPPYPSTMNKYDDFYGGIDKVFGMHHKISTDLTNKKNFLDNFCILIKTAIGKTKYIMISLNNKCYPSAEILIDKIEPFIIEYRKFTKKHVYKITGKKNKNSNYEILLLCRLKKTI